MALELNQIKDLIKNPKSKIAIREAIYQEERLKLHGEPKITNFATSGNVAETDFLRRTSNLLTDRKFRRFEQLYTYPVKTTEFFESVFNEFHKVFQANNSYVKCDFKDDEQEAEFALIQQDISDWFRVQGFRNSQTRINGLLVVDTPEDDGDPYFYFLDVKNLVDILNDEDGNAEYVIYKLGDSEKGEIFAVFDEEYYRVVELQGEEITLIKESFHGLGWCPARMMWTDDLNHTNRIVKKSPFSKSLSRMDQLLFKMVSKEYADLYASYPILSAYKPKCDYTDNFGNNCNSGRVYYGAHDNSALIGETVDCPACKGSDIIGAGTIFLVDPPEDKDQHDAIEPIKRLDADIDSLTYLREDIKALEDQIYFDVVGVIADPSTQAMNEKQVTSGFENRQNNLMQYKRNMEIAQEFVTRTTAALKYGDDFEGCVVNYGDQFFLATEEALKEDYKMTKEAGLPSWELLNMTDQLIGTKYRNSPEQRTRANILVELDPFPTMSLKELMEVESGLDPIDVIIKKNFDQFISRFERENGSLIRFGQEIDYNVKINNVLDALKIYANEKADSLISDDDNGKAEPIVD